MEQFRQDLEYMVTMITRGDNKRLKPIQFQMTFTEAELLTPISRLGLPPRAFGRLADKGFQTVADVVDNWGTLRAIPKLGRVSAEQIKVAIINLAYERYTDEQKQDFWLRSLKPLIGQEGA